MFGFSFPENFNYPYYAVSVSDFWRRWHITLSSFFRDYLYIPLGGNRKNWALNMLIVWLPVFGTVQAGTLSFGDFIILCS